MGKPIKHYDTWRIRWIDETGKRRSATFTEKKTAELALRKAELEAEERRRGLRPRELEPRTFLHASEYWRSHRAPQKRSQGDDLSMLRQLEPHFGKLLLNDRAGWVIAVDQYRTQKARLNRKTVANHLTLLGSILRVAHELGWMEQLPVIRKPRVRLHSTDYSYLRTSEEEARFLRAAVPEGRMVYVLYLTAISTGLRAGELAGLQWADVDFGTRLITVQRSFEQPTKSDDVRYVPILDSLLPELRRWRLEQPGRLVFTNQNGTMLGKCARAYQEVLRRVLDRANFPRVCWALHWDNRRRPGSHVRGRCIAPDGTNSGAEELAGSGIATYAMWCPVFPESLESGRLDELIDRSKPLACEKVWAEPYNNRTNWRFVQAGYEPGSAGWNRMVEMFENRKNGVWSAYATALYVRLRRRAKAEHWIDRLRYLLYEHLISESDAREFAGLEGILLQSPAGEDGLSKHPVFRAMQLAKLRRSA